MMLRKTSTAAHNNQSRDQPMPESRNPSLFSVTGLLVGFAKGVVAEPDSARSPTSPLDYMVFSGFGSHLVPSPRSRGAVGAPRKSWDCDRVGLGLVDSLTDGGESCCRFLLGSPENRSILLGWPACINIPSPKIHLDRLLAEGSTVSPKSLPKDYMTNAQTRVKSPCFNLGSSKMRREHSIARLELGELEKIQSCCCPHAGSLPDACDFMASLSAKNIEQSEDYTCIISHGPNPRTTRIFGDCILGSCSGDVSGFSGDHHGEEGRGCSWMVKCSEDPMSFPAEDFLRVCFSCKKKLEGKDIYMYRGEKAFCSCSCRSQEILVEEEMEEPPIDSSGPTRICCYEEVFLPGVAVAT